MEGDPEYDAAFRGILKSIAAEPMAICQRCGLDYGAHAIAAYLDDVRHSFEEQSRN
jgi:hypothetical protein